MAENAKTNKERLKEITDGIEQGIGELFQSDRYAQYLTTMSRFHKYSVNNQMLIYMQRPSATLVAGYNKWRDQFERNVKRGEKGIQIIAPTPFKKKMEMEKIDPDTQAPVLNPDGTVVMEEKEIQIPMFKPVTVFDVGQTEGKPLPTLAADLHGNVERYDFFMEALRRTSPVPMHIETMTATMDGYFDLERQDIAIREGMSEVQTVAATVHEITHAKLHNYEQERLAAPVKEGAEPPKPKDRRTEEVEAESISYAVCQYYGIQTGENSFGYIATWSKDKELPELRASLDTINKTASGLINDIDYHFRAVVKEYDVVIEAWAVDYADYTLENVTEPLLFTTREDMIAETIAAIKGGYSSYPRRALQGIEANSSVSADTLYHRLDAIELNYPQRETEAMYLLDGETYLHIQDAGEGWDYTLYNKDTLEESDGGVIDDNDDISFSIDDAYVAALEIQSLHPETSEKVSLDIMDDIRAAREQAVEDYMRENNMRPLSDNRRMDEALSSHRAADLIASYEELFVDRQEDRKVQWAGDYHLYVPKDGVSRETQYEAYLISLDTLGVSHKDFMESDRYSQRGYIVVDMCQRNDMPIPDYILSQLPQEERAQLDPAQMSEVERWEADHITDFTVTEQTVKSPIQSAAPVEAPEAPEQAHYYPMPDPDFSVEDLEDCGYIGSDMLPLSQLRALELYDKDLTIYVIHGGGEASMVFDSSEIENHGGLFAVPYDEWELVKGELAPAESRDLSEQSFLDAPHDAYAIYQVKHGELYRDYRFESLEALQNKDRSPDRDNYNLVYVAAMPDTGNTPQKLDAIYQQFNVNHPADFRGHSLTVSDIVALKQSGKVTYYYCDSFDFVPLPGFNSGKNPLRAVEDAIEQNDNNLDGIINNTPAPSVAEMEAQVRAGQTISLMDLARAAHAEDKEKRPSVLEKLRQPQPPQERKKSAPSKGAELEL